MTFKARLGLIPVLLFFLLLKSAPAAQAEYTAWDKGGRGVANIVTCPYEIARQMIIDINGPRGGFGFFTGGFRGFCYGIGRGLAGVYDLVTFPIPLPAGYRPWVLPEYIIPSTPRKKAQWGENDIERVY